jgi:bifunctional non-homologous end joining protein LigD
MQKHLASHLHYDLRLEHRGVLRSWAVPKGPSTDPAVKRLAMQVEDHPLAYGAFEGVIPSGYGAGIVMLWDTGRWSPLVEDVDAALAAGHLPFVIQGTKLRGRWDLIRAHHIGERAWLLVKGKDAWTATEDITERAPDSVTRHGGFAHILSRAPSEPWQDRPPATGGEAGAMFRQILAQSRVLRGRGKVQGNASAWQLHGSSRPQERAQRGRRHPAPG